MTCLKIPAFAQSCEETPNGKVEHCVRDDIDQGGGGRVEAPAGTQSGFGGNDSPYEGCTGGLGYHDGAGAPNQGAVGSSNTGINCDL